MQHSRQRAEGGFTLTELVIGLTVLAIVAISLTGLFTALVNSSVVAKQKAVGTTLATNQMEYLKSLPYDSLAVAGGSIASSSPLPATTTQKVNGVTYTIKTSISYVDDAYDGCISYPTVAIEQAECRNFVVHAGAPTSDSDPKDYKVADVAVYNRLNVLLASVDTEISARVAETGSTTGALFVTVVDSNGNPVNGATVNVTNNVVVPAVNVSDTTDQNGIAIFYDLTPDSANYNYNVTGSASGYSTLSTIVPAGALQPTYPSQKIFTQQSSSLTLTLKLQGPDSLLVETTDTSGNPLPGVKVYAKGGYKKYTLAADTSYYFDNLSPSDSRPVTDAAGLAAISNLVPGNYIFCGDLGATSCVIGGTAYYVAAALPYSGINPFNPITVPIYNASSPPTTTFSYSGHNYYQKVRLMLTTTLTFPRINSMSASSVSLTGGSIASFAFQLSGTNLPCNAVAASCGTSVKFLQGANTYTASCTGSGGSLISCTVNLTGVSVGNARMVLTANGFTLTMPDLPLMGGISVTP